MRQSPHTPFLDQRLPSGTRQTLSVGLANWFVDADGDVVTHTLTLADGSLAQLDEPLDGRMGLLTVDARTRSRQPGCSARASRTARPWPGTALDLARRCATSEPRPLERPHLDARPGARLPAPPQTGFTSEPGARLAFQPPWRMASPALLVDLDAQLGRLYGTPGTADCAALAPAFHSQGMPWGTPSLPTCPHHRHRTAGRPGLELAGWPRWARPTGCRCLPRCLLIRMWATTQRWQFSASRWQCLADFADIQRKHVHAKHPFHGTPGDYALLRLVSTDKSGAPGATGLHARWCLPAQCRTDLNAPLALVSVAVAVWPALSLAVTAGSSGWQCLRGIGGESPCWH